jgi:PIN domain nuclease of toxin-antitoxin system
VIKDGCKEIYFSAASTGEVAIKAGKGLLILPEAPGRNVTSHMSQHRLLALPIQLLHTLRVHDLPPHHADPFDRLLIVQSQIESLPLITKDEEIRRYEVETIW